jgi:parallel beta-helix repeat protein
MVRSGSVSGDVVPAWLARVIVVAGALAASCAVGSTATAAPSAPPVEPPRIDAPLGESKEVRGERGVRSYEPNPAAVLTARRELHGTGRWAIVVGRQRIELLRGATRVRTVPRARGGADITLPEVAAAIDDPRWIEENDDGVFLLRAALVHGRNTRLTIAGPRVSELRLADRPDVFLLGANGARGIIRDTKIVGWDERRATVDTEHELSRPFILYTFGGQLDVLRSEIAYLGYNRGSAYGLSWREQRATGSVVDSNVHHLFFGMYSYEAIDIELRDSRWHDCVYYGIDPHDFTEGMVVVGNESFGNGSHGIIFSNGVSGGTVRGNVVHDNGGNGIVMDYRSDAVTITGNVVRDNGGDGIVVLGSSDVEVTANEVTGNRVGLRVNLTSNDNVFADNEVAGNRVGVQVYGGARSTMVRGNVIRDSRETGIIADGARTHVEGGSVVGGDVGIDVRGLATVTGTTIEDVRRGVSVRETGIVRARDLQISASEVGVQAPSGSLVRVFGSEVFAPEPFRGIPRDERNNVERLPWSSLWLVGAGVAFVLVAVLLHLVHQIRNPPHRRRDRMVAAPPGVTNAR